MAHKTINRGLLLRRARASRLFLVGSYSYDDMSGSNRTAGQRMPIALADGVPWQERKPGHAYLHESDFSTSSGCAWANEDGTVTLIVHSNCNYTLRVEE